jgi:hypothetical protein
MMVGAFEPEQERTVMTDTPTSSSGTGSPVPVNAEPADDGALLILAVDHRNSFERDLYGLTGPPTPAQAARISADKLLVYQSAARRCPPAPAERATGPVGRRGVRGHGRRTGLPLGRCRPPGHARGGQRRRVVQLRLR